MVAWRDVDLLWRPSEELNAARHELQDAQQWLEGKKLKSVPSTPFLKKTVAPVNDSIPQQEGDMPVKPPAAVMADCKKLVPHDKDIDDGEESESRGAEHVVLVVRV